MRYVIGLMLFSVAAFGQPHTTRIQNATDQEGFLLDGAYWIRTIGEYDFCRELFMFGLGRDSLLSASETHDPGATRYNQFFNPANPNSLVSRLNARAALEALKKHERPRAEYMTVGLIRDATLTWPRALPDNQWRLSRLQAIQRRIDSVDQPLGAE